jgi:tRNA-specific 2-thiouridylase
MKERVAVAMSGGVDSSVAAALLSSQGFEVIGVTMCFDFTPQVIKDAKKVANKLNIKHYTFNMQKALRKYVIKDFCQEYIKGRTPNPCVRCNKFIKFDCLLKKAVSLGATYLATGHYAKVTKSSRDQITRYLLKKAKDKHKDQSYFLYRLNQRQLKDILFPLGDYTKEEVRKMAKSLGLGVAEKRASQEICFLPNQNYRGFLRNNISGAIKPGLIVDKDGDILGAHKGIAFYTIGQREGLGIAKGYPLYITKIDPGKNQITVGAKEDALKKEFLVKELNFIFKPIKKKVVLKVKIRYNHKEATAQLLPIKDKIKVKFKKGQFAITPGQSAVFLDKDKVVGGGIIDRVLN